MIFEAKLGAGGMGGNGRIEDLMVIFADGVPEVEGRGTGDAFEEAVEICGVFKSERITDLLYGEGCMQQRPFRFQDDALVDEAGGCSASLFAQGIVQVSRRHVEEPGIVRYLMQRIKFFIQQLFHSSYQGRGLAGRRVNIELAGIEPAEVDEEYFQVGLQHAIFPIFLLLVFCLYLPEEVIKKVLVGL